MAAPALPTPTSSAGDRVIDVLEAFETDALTLDEVRARTGLTRTTTYRILSMLLRRRWIEHSPDGYRLTFPGQQASTAADGLESLRAAAAGPLNELHLATGAVAHLSVLEGSMTCHVDKVGGRAWSQIPSSVGVRLPATETAAGRAMLAFLTPEQIDNIVAGLDDPQSLDRGELDRALVMVRRNRGVATRDGGTLASRISTAAAPVLGTNGPVGAISVAWRHPGADANRAAGLVSWAARQISESLAPVRS